MNQSNNDEIDLFELLKIFARYKILILSITTISFLAAICYTMITKPLYKTSVTIAPPTSETLEILKINRIVSPSFFLDSITSLSSHKGWELFSKENDFSSIEFKITPPRKAQSDYIVELIGTEPDQITAILNSFLEYAELNRRKEILNLRREILEIQRERLVNSLEIARKLKISNPAVTSAFGIENMEYMKGTTALEMEIAQLDSLAQKSSLDGISFYNISGSVITPKSPFSPKKNLIFPVSIVLGVALGSVLALSLNAINSQRRVS